MTVPDNTFHFYIDNNRYLTAEVGYSPGKKFNCPRCNSEKITFLFKPGFRGIDIQSWCSIIHDEIIELCNVYQIIMKNNFSPLWLCKDCYDGGVVLKVWSDPRDLISTQTYQKIQDIFSKFEKNFTEKSEPIFVDKMGKKISLKKLHAIESIKDKPISMIAVTRHQYDLSNFPRYVNYVKNKLRVDRVYFGLWPDDKKTEYDVLYAIGTDDYEQIQNHLNAHSHMNQGVAQVMALIISSDGEWKPVKNDN